MKKAYTITIVSETRQGKAVIMAKSYKDAMNQARQACPEGFRVFEVQENEREQRGFHRHSPVKCALGGVAEAGRLYKPSRRPAFWTGKKRGNFKKC